MTEATKRVYNKPIRIAEIFQKRPGEKISVFELMQILNLSKDQVQTAIHRIRNIELTVVTRGQVWVYNPDTARPAITVEPAPVARMVFDYVGRTKRDHIIVRDLDDNLYTLNPLDV